MLVDRVELILQQMELEAKEDRIPIAKKETMELLSLLIVTTRSKTILEVGTAIGYSTIWLVKAMNEPMGKVTTIELSQLRHRRAKEYFQRAGFGKKIDSICGDALSIMPQMQGQYDLIFLDAAKGQYLDFFYEAYRLLMPGGLLVADNVLFKGMVYSGSNYPRRKRTLVKRLEKFICLISRHPNLISSVVPVGDGVAICLKKGGDMVERP
jgi:predicted O-methyltransferase YrrM